MKKPQSDSPPTIDGDGQTIIEPNPPLPEFKLADLPEKLSQAVSRQGWSDLLPVQKKAIPYILNATDLIVQSKTGSGKTAAFGLPLLQVIEGSVRQPQALILVPTRELAKQVCEDLSAIGKDTGIDIAAIYGGVGYGPQLKSLEGGCHLLVGTPGRVLDHLMRGTLNLSCLRDLVLDEADEMLSMGFYPDMKRIQKFLPKERCSYMFSATMPTNVRRLAAEFLRSPKFLSMCPSDLSISQMDHVFYQLDAMQKDTALLKIIELENPESALIFCNTKRDVQYLYEYLGARGLNTGLLSGNISQSDREKMLRNLKSRKIRFLVATDVAARGIDIQSLSHVILYDQPDDAEVYVHRSGRTARAGKTGLAISLVTKLEEMALKKTGEKFGIRFIRKAMPNDEELEAVVRERALVYLEQEFRDLKRPQVSGAARMLPLLKQLMESDEGQMDAAMVLYRFYWEKFTGLRADKIQSTIVEARA